MFNSEHNILSTMWKAWDTTQNFNQTLINFFNLLSNKEKCNNSSCGITQELTESCISYLTYNAAMANKLFTALMNIKTQEDLLSLKENVFFEHNEKNMHYIQKIFNLYHQLLQKNYNTHKNNAENIMQNCQHASSKIMENFTSNINKFNHNAQHECSTQKNNNHSQGSSCAEESKHHCNKHNSPPPKKNGDNNKNCCNKNNYSEK